jgi:hypothetical protein
MRPVRRPGGVYITDGTFARTQNRLGPPPTAVQPRAARTSPARNPLQQDNEEGTG